MAAYSYLVFMLRAAVFYRPKELYRLSQLETGDDLLELVLRELGALGPAYYREQGTSDGYRIMRPDRHGRVVFLKLNRGPEGTGGETYNVRDQSSIATTRSHAQLSRVRALVAIPEHSYYGLLFVERVGGRHLKQLLSDVALYPAARRGGAALKIETFAEGRDWRSLLASQEVVSVTEHLESHSSDEDHSTDDPRSVRITVSTRAMGWASESVAGAFAARAERAGRRIDQRAVVATMAAGKDAFSVQDRAAFDREVAILQSLDVPGGDETKLAKVIGAEVDVDRSLLEHKSWSVETKANGTPRTFTVESNAIPQFAYELGGQLPDRGLRDHWITHAEGILTRRGLTIPADWTVTKN